MNEQIFSKNPASVLMVDDTPANLELLSGMLKVRGYRVRAAISGKLALQAALNDPPDLILLDVNMPEMNGYEVCEKLKAEEKLKNIPVIFLSALSDTIDKVKAFGAGGVDYITKPFQFEEVEARVETHLELRRRNLLLQEAYNKLNELEKLRDSLVHMIVHDLRSPLTGVCAYLDILAAGKAHPLSAEQAGCVQEAKKTAGQMIQIVSDVLDVSKMEGGQMKLNLAECDLAAAAEECLAGFKALSRNRAIKFTPPGGPVTVRADKEIVIRVIQNLLGNALKFTQDNGNILIEVARAGERARLSVHDDGPGIAPEYRQRIFEKFAQVELPSGRQKYSTGLGLTFCKMAVEAHGGAIGVASEEGKGSTFWFELPSGGPGRA